MRGILFLIGAATVTVLSGGCTHQWFRQRPTPWNFAADVLEGAASAIVVVPSAALVVPDQVVHAIATTVATPPPPKPVEPATYVDPDTGEQEVIKELLPQLEPEAPTQPADLYVVKERGRARERRTPGNVAADLLEGSWSLVRNATLGIVILASLPPFAIAAAISQEPPRCRDRLHDRGGYRGPKWERTDTEERHRAALEGY